MSAAEAEIRRLRTELERREAELDELIANPPVEVETEYVQVPDRAIAKAWITSQVKLVKRHGREIAPLMAEQKRLVDMLLSGDPDGKLNTHHGGV